MILADKIINLRKKESMTQEDLAHEIGVSRQSVSKWESSMAMPDLDKIIKLSNIFGVSTDFLLNDDLGMENIIVNDNEEVREQVVDIDRLNEYYDIYEKIAKLIAFAIPLFILSSFPVLALEDKKENLGIILLLIIVAIAVGICIHAGFLSNKVEYIEKEPYSFAYGVEGIIKKNIDEYTPKLKRNIIIAVMLYILSPVIYLTTEPAMEGSKLTTYIFLIIIAIATGFISYTMIKYSSYKEILAYRNPRVQKSESKLSKFSALLWVSAVAGYLLFSFMTGLWDRSWIIFVVATVIQVGLSIFFEQ